MLEDQGNVWNASLLSHFLCHFKSQTILVTLHAHYFVARDSGDCKNRNPSEVRTNHWRLAARMALLVLLSWWTRSASGPLAVASEAGTKASYSDFVPIPVTFPNLGKLILNPFINHFSHGTDYFIYSTLVGSSNIHECSFLSFHIKSWAQVWSSSLFWWARKRAMAELVQY